MKTDVTLIKLPETSSTNTWVAEHASELESLTYVSAVEQTAGRGQRGNCWESEPGKNLTFSVLWRPHYFRANRQFSVSEAVALGVVDALEDFGIQAKVKWPNDIYVGDRKICGILIEHAVMGSGVMHSVCGVGVNVNQDVFVSDAPNPVSMFQLTGDVYDTDSVMSSLMSHVSTRLRNIDMETEENIPQRVEDFLSRQHNEFLEKMWRNDGREHLFYDVNRDETYKGVICGVAPDGYLMIEVKSARQGFSGNYVDQTVRRYAFKEVVFK